MKTTEREPLPRQDLRSATAQPTRLLTLTGLPGILAGLIGTGGAAGAHAVVTSEGGEASKIGFIALIGAGAALLTIGCSAFHSARRLSHWGKTAWSAADREVVREMATPLLAGLMFTAVLVMHRMFMAIPGSLLVFYGLSLDAAAKATRPEVRWLAWIEIALGMIAFVFTEHALTYWAVGFGISHILYGGLMYFKDEV
ncbi:MAG: hypothetical protein AB1428_06960 [Bacteroidota bacterium]